MMVMKRRSVAWLALSFPCGIESLLKPGNMDIICGRKMGEMDISEQATLSPLLRQKEG
jgi:hypothetical protein